MLFNPFLSICHAWLIYCCCFTLSICWLTGAFMLFYHSLTCVLFDYILRVTLITCTSVHLWKTNQFCSVAAAVGCFGRVPRITLTHIDFIDSWKNNQHQQHCFILCELNVTRLWIYVFLHYWPVVYATHRSPVDFFSQVSTNADKLMFLLWIMWPRFEHFNKQSNLW